jgi:hypothetical protein
MGVPFWTTISRNNPPFTWSFICVVVYRSLLPGRGPVFGHNQQCQGSDISLTSNVLFLLGNSSRITAHCPIMTFRRGRPFILSFVSMQYADFLEDSYWQDIMLKVKSSGVHFLITTSRRSLLSTSVCLVLPRLRPEAGSSRSW